MDFTSMSFCGRLTDDPKLFTTANGKSICRFTVATSRRTGKDSKSTSFLPVMVVGKDAETCSTYLSKGREVLVTGAQFETDKYTDDSGTTRKTFTFVVGTRGHVEFGSGGAKSNSESGDSVMTKTIGNLREKLNRDSGK